MTVENLSPTPYRRLNEALGFVCLAFGILLMLSFISYNVQDASWNTAGPAGKAQVSNLMGRVGATLSDLCLQCFGLGSIIFPLSLFGIGLRWLHSRQTEAPTIRVLGACLFLLFLCTGLSLPPSFQGAGVTSGGLLGMMMASFMISLLNFSGAALITLLCLVLSLYLVSSFSVAKATKAIQVPVRMAMNSMAFLRGLRSGAWLPVIRQKQVEADPAPIVEPPTRFASRRREKQIIETPAPIEPEVPPAKPVAAPRPDIEDMPPFPDLGASRRKALEDPKPAPEPEPETPPIVEQKLAPPPPPRPEKKATAIPTSFDLPSTDLLNEPPARNHYDPEELHQTAARIEEKFKEFNVFGKVVQINPGPVVTTFEFKPDSGVKYSKITALHEDLCMGLQAESILIDRIPGRPTVGIEVPNRKSEIISLRQVLESEVFNNSASRLTMSQGKDINGNIKCFSMETMPHLLVAGSTGSGKSVMLNSMIMSVLYKSTPDEVRMIMIDPKRVELGIYEGIPHLLTPVITDPRKATNALRNAVFEMERRLKLLAAHGVRNIDQFNRKVREMAGKPLSLFDEQLQGGDETELRPLPYILLIIDELADLMMLERQNVEHSVARLAQMARAVGMHLVLATQRPSVDVITGVIKANFPARMSFRVASRVDSRTILDGMGAEHLLGKGDMLFMPPGSSRLMRVHGAYVTEQEINRVVGYWKQQAKPEYDQSFLLAPPSEDGDAALEDGEEEFNDPAYRDAARVVCDEGKASTSILQRRLRLGYGRAARILDRMQREGIIGPPDGSRPREILRRPDWLDREPEVGEEDED
jgi:DNA segregation ATPase FtsK/SpoIIIE, S-DNA-T family